MGVWFHLVPLCEVFQHKTFTHTTLPNEHDNLPFAQPGVHALGIVCSRNNFLCIKSLFNAKVNKTYHL